MKNIAVLNGPNLNLLGQREPGIYGDLNLENINKNLYKEFSGRAALTFFQSNHEGSIIDFIQKCEVNAMVVNFGGFTHTSVAIRDALLAKKTLFVEVHLSNLFKREPFRHHSYFTDISIGFIAGFGPFSYSLGILAVLNYLDKNN